MHIKSEIILIFWEPTCSRLHGSIRYILILGSEQTMNSRDHFHTCQVQFTFQYLLNYPITSSIGSDQWKLVWKSHTNCEHFDTSDTSNFFDDLSTSNLLGKHSRVAGINKNNSSTFFLRSRLSFGTLWFTFIAPNFFLSGITSFISLGSFVNWYWGARSTIRKL